MADGAGAKYLNSPETPLFDKGRSLYNHGPARGAVGKDQPLIVAEGYMDVIALVRAGFEGAVAPLGTAITEDQLRMIWRLSREPIIALDGDTAGLRAGYRLMDLALPHLGAEQSMRFCLLPGKMDPDDVLRQGGAGAMRKLLDGAVPLVQLMWQRETEGQVFSTPESRAALEQRISTIVKSIVDTEVRKSYNLTLSRQIKDYFWTLDMKERTEKKRDLKQPRPTNSSKSSLLAISDNMLSADQLNEELIMAIMLKNPDLLRDFEYDLEKINFVSELAEECRIKFINGNLDEQTSQKVVSIPHVVQSKLFHSSDQEKLTSVVRNTFDILNAKRGQRIEANDAIEDLAKMADEGLTWRLAQAADARAKSERSNLNDQTDLGEDRAALKGQLDRLIESQVWIKRKK
jgi:DNA primase